MSSSKNDPNYLPQGELNPKRIFDTAHSFLLAAQHCNEPCVQTVGWSQILLVPVVVNTALSCELFLKAIHKKGGVLQEATPSKSYFLPCRIRYRNK